MTVIGPGTRVKCVRTDWDNRPGPSVGTVWTVIEIEPKGTCIESGGNIFVLGADYFRFKEWAFKQLWRADCFVPLEGNEDLSTLTGCLRQLVRA